MIENNYEENIDVNISQQHQDKSKEYIPLSREELMEIFLENFEDS